MYEMTIYIDIQIQKYYIDPKGKFNAVVIYINVKFQ